MKESSERGAALRATREPRLVHIITGLQRGGAEMMLYKLLSASAYKSDQVTVISLTGDGPVGDQIRALGVRVRILGLNPRLPNLALLVRLSVWIRDARPDVVQTWMYHSDVIGGFAAKLAKRSLPVIWNIRASRLDSTVIGPTARAFARASAWLSKAIPQRIITCSQTGLEQHAALGYCRNRLVVIPNGFDLTQFRPNPDARWALRTELGIPEDALVIGHIARFHPMKNHRGLVEAARRLAAILPTCQFLLCGDRVTWENPQLSDWIQEAGLRDAFHLLGERADMQLVYPALDIATMTSVAVEGFPNVLGEAMACGVPCVATDVGDAAYVIGDTGLIVRAGDDAALAQAWFELWQRGPQGRQDLAQRAHRRVQGKFDLSHIASLYHSLYRNQALRPPRWDRAEPSCDRFQS